MDGIQGKLTQSLRFKLSLWLLVSILGLGLVSGILAYKTSFHEANELQDDQLKQVAALINRHGFVPNYEETIELVPHTDPETSLIVEKLSQASLPKAALVLPANIRNGLHTVFMRDESWRVFVSTLNNGEQFAVGQKTAVRDEAANRGAWLTLLPFMVLVPVMFGIVAILIRQVITPISQQARALDARSDTDLSPIAIPDLPDELIPFATAINRLFERVGQLLEAQQRFVSDAAHELRSPLTAFSLQLERLESEDIPPQAQDKVVTLRGGLDRMHRLLEQLLTLARIQAPHNPIQGTIVIHDALRHVLEDLMPLAERKNIEVEVSCPDASAVHASQLDMTLLLKNLIENALRYTPHGGRVTIFVYDQASHITLQIDDTGPGIPASERQRVFDPFYRVIGNDAPGAGLGLSIVKTIIARIGATVKLANTQQGTESNGLSVIVTFPL